MPTILQSTFHRNGLLLSAGLSTLVLLAISPPFLSSPAAGWIMKAFASVCHQLPERSFHVDGVSLAVCHRCLGAYLGLLVGALVFLFLAREPKSLRPLTLLIFAALPGIVDWSGDVLGFWINTPMSRVITGAFFGVLAGTILGSAVMGKRQDPSA
jgi:uncharacterized membrane protein